MGDSTEKVKVVYELDDKASPAMKKMWLEVAKGTAAWDITKSAMMKAVGFMKGSLDAFAEEEAAINKLATAMANNGTYTKKALQSQVDFAAAMQKTTAYSDDAVIAAQSLMATFGMSPAIMNETTKAAMNMSSALGMDLQTSSMLLSKAFAGNVAMLSRYGIVVDDSIPKGKQFESVIMQLNDRFGNAAQNELNTYAGNVKQLANEYNDLQEQIGKELQPVIKDFLPTMRDLAGVTITAVKGLGEALLWLRKKGEELGAKIGWANSFAIGAEMIRKAGKAAGWTDEQIKVAVDDYRISSLSFQKETKESAGIADKFAGKVNKSGAALLDMSESAVYARERLKELNKEMQDTGKSFNKYITDQIVEGTFTMDDAFQWLKKRILKALIEETFMPVEEGVNGVVKAVRSGFTGIVSGAGAFLGGVMQWIVQRMWDLSNWIIKPVADTIGSFIENAGNIIGNFISGVGTIASILTSAVGAFVVGVGSFLVGVAEFVASTVAEAAKTVWDLIFGFFGFQKGGHILSTGLALLHEGETVVPKGMSPLAATGIPLSSTNENISTNSTINNGGLTIIVQAQAFAGSRLEAREFAKMIYNEFIYLQRTGQAVAIA